MTPADARRAALAETLVQELHAFTYVPEEWQLREVVARVLAQEAPPPLPQEWTDAIARAHGDGQQHAIDDVNKGLIDDLIAPRLHVFADAVATSCASAEKWEQRCKQTESDLDAAEARLRELEQDRDEWKATAEMNREFAQSSWRTALLRSLLHEITGLEVAASPEDPTPRS